MIGYMAAGALSGVISAMGMGGGAILIPALSFFFKLDQHQAQNINLLYFIPTAVIALISHFKSGNIEKRVLSPMIITGLMGAGIGSLIAVSLDAGILRKAFGAFLLLMGLYEMFSKTESSEQDEESKQDEKTTKKEKAMDALAFNQIKQSFEQAQTAGKIEIYTQTEGLSRDQYKELLRLYPYDEIDKLEKALG